jgi:adenosylcobinamide kinase / adenosylcobinamide-phosphate guanylyltransferase
MGILVLVLGGARSGKSAFAVTLAMEAQRATFVATAEGRDQEMRRKIAAHRRSRPRGWQTVEVPVAVPRAVAKARADVVIVDCLSLWLSNLALDSRKALASRERAIISQVRALVRVAQQRSGMVVIVSNEVGMGVVPATPLGRVYRDLLGRANQLIAAAADQVYLLVAGIPVEVRRWAGR